MLAGSILTFFDFCELFQKTNPRRRTRQEESVQARDSREKRGGTQISVVREREGLGWVKERKWKKKKRRLHKQPRGQADELHHKVNTSHRQQSEEEGRADEDTPSVRGQRGFMSLFKFSFIEQQNVEVHHNLSLLLL